MWLLVFGISAALCGYAAGKLPPFPAFDGTWDPICLVTFLVAIYSSQKVERQIDASKKVDAA